MTTPPGGYNSAAQRSPRTSSEEMDFREKSDDRFYEQPLTPAPVGADVPSKRKLVWTFEFLSLLCGVGAMIVIAVVLSQADGRPPPNWPLGITLNTLLAFLTSFAKFAFTLPIVEGLAQLKWIWFTSPEARPLADFALFENASRGPWGCIKLLLRFRGTLACFGALIAISGVITSTLTQQAVDYHQLLANSTDGTATAPRATIFSLFNGSNLALGPQEMVRGKQAMFNGVLSNSTSSLPPNMAECSSGTCDWEPYGSLSVCSEVVNLTEAASPQLLSVLTTMADRRLGALLNSTSLFMSEGLFFNVFPMASLPPAFPILVGVMPTPSGMFNDSVNQLMVGNYFVAYSNDQLTGPDIATSPLLFLEVAMYWCTKTFVTRVRDGLSDTTELGTAAIALTPNPHTLNFAWSPDFAKCYIGQNCQDTLGPMEVELQAPPAATVHQSRERYTVNVWTSLLSSILLGSTMYDSLLMDQTRGIIVSTGGGVAQAFATAMFGDFLATKSPDAEAQWENAKGIAANLARSITNHIRDGDTRFVGNGSSTATVYGTVYSPQTLVRIRWEYIGLLAAQIAFTSCFLAAVVIVTASSGTQALKGSSLVTMTALSDDTRRHLVEKGDPDKPLVERAGQIKVRLERGESEGLQLSMMQRFSRHSFPGFLSLDTRQAGAPGRRDARHADVGAWI